MTVRFFLFAMILEKSHFHLFFELTIEIFSNISEYINYNMYLPASRNKKAAFQSMMLGQPVTVYIYSGFTWAGIGTLGAGILGIFLYHEPALPIRITAMVGIIATSVALHLPLD